jgi:hypothetical protein
MLLRRLSIFGDLCRWPDMYGEGDVFGQGQFHLRRMEETILALPLILIIPTRGWVGVAAGFSGDQPLMGSKAARTAGVVTRKQVHIAFPPVL